MPAHIKRSSLWDYAQFAVSKIVWFGEEGESATPAPPALILGSDIPPLVVMLTRDVKTGPEALEELATPDAIRAAAVIKKGVDAAIASGALNAYDPVAFVQLDPFDASAQAGACLVRFDDLSAWLGTQGIEIGSDLPTTGEAKAAVDAALIKPLSTRERDTLLTIIAVLCGEAKLDHRKASKSAELIADMAAGAGISISKRAIENHLKKIPDALGSRTK